jgi:hypothetical protein
VNGVAGTADDRIDLSLGLSPAARKAIAARAVAHGVTLDQAFEDVLAEGMAMLARKRAIGHQPRSRNAREGQFIGRAWGRATRRRTLVRSKPRGQRARDTAIDRAHRAAIAAIRQQVQARS